MKKSFEPAGSFGDREDVLLTEQQLALRWNASVKTLQAHRLKGTGCPFVRIGRLVRYSAHAVAAYESNHTFSSTVEADHDR